MTEQSQNSENNTKITAYYNAAYQGWVTSSLERDKSLLTISAGAIGLIVTLLTTVGPATVKFVRGRTKLTN